MKWSSAEYISGLAARNRLCREYGFIATECSGLQGFYDALASADSAPNVIAVDDSSDSVFSTANSPSFRTVRTVYIAMRHKAADMQLRQKCLDIIKEVFRQFLTSLIKERIRLENHCIYLDPDIQMHEIESYFFTGAAAAFLQIAVETPVSLVYNPEEWNDPEDGLQS